MPKTKKLRVGTRRLMQGLKISRDMAFVYGVSRKKQATKLKSERKRAPKRTRTKMKQLGGPL